MSKKKKKEKLILWYIANIKHCPKIWSNMCKRKRAAIWEEDIGKCQKRDDLRLTCDVETKNEQKIENGWCSKLKSRNKYKGMREVSRNGERTQRKRKKRETNKGFMMCFCCLSKRGSVMEKGNCQKSRYCDQQVYCIMYITVKAKRFGEWIICSYSHWFCCEICR